MLQQGEGAFPGKQNYSKSCARSGDQELWAPFCYPDHLMCPLFLPEIGISADQAGLPVAFHRQRTTRSFHGKESSLTSARLLGCAGPKVALYLSSCGLHHEIWLQRSQTESWIPSISGAGLAFAVLLSIFLLMSCTLEKPCVRVRMRQGEREREGERELIMPIKGTDSD